MSSSHEKSPALRAALDGLAEGASVERTVLRDAVRELLAELARRAPGRSVEVRVPPYGAIQCVEGPRHTRGTPPNVVETDPITFLGLASGSVTWEEGLRTGRIRASGIRADISHLFPVF
ncbi:sterol carrier family protein [Allorhizocola rhizosphaerae]|uniref:sterol carrier family protein n=1 Tax=Allorhizocola rhizosphaerae TaxID=1872709 RepID=UPI000E3C439A|nr:sterol carrier family protein [Allorhizocola rhizosphaerae]